MHLVQLKHGKYGRRIASVQDETLLLIEPYTNAFDLAKASIEQKVFLTDLIKKHSTKQTLDYQLIHSGASDWKLLPAFDHPVDPRFCMVSGTGLTHQASAQNRQNMHEAGQSGKLTDSMILYQWGAEGGRPQPGKIGIQPEWFYKGNGSVLRGHLDELIIPSYGLDGGEEPEIAGIYINDAEGQAHRVGFATANEFSDHVMEKKNYLYLAPSKIRNCALGPELVITDQFRSISGKVSVIRNGHIVWEKTIHTGEEHITHTLSNLEYHHFKYENHRLPWDAHIHFMGADAFSFGAGIKLEPGDQLSIQWDGMGKPLINTLKSDLSEERLFLIPSL